jgi:hypothetical protein
LGICFAHPNFTFSFWAELQMFVVEKIDIEQFQSELQRSIDKLPTALPTTTESIDSMVKGITISIQNSIDKQKKLVNHNKGKIKPWWDGKILDPIADKRNRAQMWMMLSRSPASFNCYNYWQNKFKETIIDMKKGHWRKFLAECNDKNLFKAYKYTKPNNNNTVAPLLNDNNILTSNKEEQACLLFKGTSDVPMNENTVDTQSFSLSSPFFFPAITPTELKQIVDKSPKKKARGHDDIPNEVIKWSLEVLQDTLIKLFNACLNLGYFPPFCKKCHNHHHSKIKQRYLLFRKLLLTNCTSFMPRQNLRKYYY